jgi:hypothetical protein
MRAWLSFPTAIRRVRLGASVNLNTSARMHHKNAAAINRRNFEIVARM